ncbi:hypothetical protein MMC22_009218 [Lobaria immixta]|nr:hypothetical protein [Lobaria immixta]
MTPPPAKICVFCSTGDGKSPAHLEAAGSLARAMHAHRIHLIYGGGTSGMTGKLARELVALSGPDSVHGIIPEGIIRAERQGVAVDEADRQYGKTTVVVDLQTRKKTMLEEVIGGGPGSGFIGLSGGFGTMDELMEAVTWNQLGVHNTGVCLFNVERFWNGVLSWLDDATKAGFIRDDAKGILVAKETPEECLEWLKGYIPAGTRLNQTLKDA